MKGRRLTACVAVVSLIAVVGTLMSGQGPVEVEGNDLAVYLEGADGLAANGNPYGTGFVSPPPFAMLLQPLRLLPRQLAGWVWLIFSVSALCLAIGVALAIAGVENWWVLVLGALAALFWPPSWYGLQLGQSSFFVALLLVAAIASARTVPAAAGTLLGIATLMKPQLSLVVLAGLAYQEFVLSRGVRIGVSCCATGIVATISTWLYSRRWLDLLLEAPPESWNYWGSTIGLNVALAWILDDRPASWFVMAVVVATLSLALGFWIIRTRPSSPRLGAALVSATLLSTPYAYPHDYVILVAPLLWAVRGSLLVNGAIGGALAVSLVVVAWFAPMPARYDEWRFVALVVPAVILALAFALPTLVHCTPYSATATMSMIRGNVAP